MRATMVLAVICIVLAATLWLELNRPPPSWTGSSEPDADAPLALAPSTLPPVAMPTAAMIETIKGRPLFDPKRRPPQVASASGSDRKAPSAAEPSPSAPAIDLAGTLMTAGGKAAMVTISGASPRWIRLGDLIEGWQVVEIGSTRMALRRGGKIAEIHLREASPEPKRLPLKRQGASKDSLQAKGSDRRAAR